MTERNEMNRRYFLEVAGKTVGLTAGLNLLSTSSAMAASKQSDLDKYDFLLPRLKFASQTGVHDYWHARPGGDANLLNEMKKVIRCKTKPVLGTNNWSPSKASENQFNAVVSFDEPEELINYPMLLMTGESPYRLSRDQKQSMVNYVKQGGFLFMDDCMSEQHRDLFYQSSYKLLEELFGRGSVKRVPNSHEIFNNVYDLSNIGLPFMNGVENGARGIFIDGRLAILLSSHDVHCGWCDRAGHVFKYQANPSGGIGPWSYKEAIRMGINMIMYAISH